MNLRPLGKVLGCLRPPSTDNRYLALTVHVVVYSPSPLQGEPSRFCPNHKATSPPLPKQRVSLAYGLRW